MTTGNSGSGQAAGQGRVKRALPRLGLRNWRVRWRLTALVLVPTIAGVVLGGARVVGSVQSIGDYDRTALAAEQAGRIRDLVQALGVERDTGGWMAASSRARKSLAGVYKDRKAKVDGLVRSVQSDMTMMDDSYGVRVAAAVKRTGYDFGVLNRTRSEGQKDTTRYDSLLDSLLRLHDELSLLSDDSQIVGQFRALSALARAKEEISKQRVQLLKGHYNSASVDAKEVERFIASNARQRAEIAAVGQEAGPDVGLALSKALTAPEYYNTELTKSRAITLAAGKAPGVRIRDNLLAATDRAKPAPDQWFDDNATTIDILRKVEGDLSQKVALRSQELRDAETRSAIIAGVLIVALLLLVLLLTVGIARSIIAPLRRLRTEALEIAGFRLPDVVRRLRVTGDAPADVRPIEVDGDDEIGEVARAFDQVHRQAVRLAGEEAELRSNISSMFVNLSRRTQTLVERQISLIDGLEKGEQDGGRLADLFKLDHLATRMRRNSENLLVLAGHEASRRRSQPAKLVDVVRAALSEVEGYERVQVKVHRSTSVLGSAANDLVHLVAELVENAIQFSPKNAPVMVSSSLIEGGGALLSVNDTGISMTEEELAEANRRLAEPPVVDVSVSRRMGLFVVGRLALRHGIRVQLRKGDGAGLIAMILLPPALVADASRPPLPQRPAYGPNGPVTIGSGPVPSTPQTGVPAPNGTFRSFASFDPLDTSGNNPARPFTADTDGGAHRPSFDTGGYPSYPSPKGPFNGPLNAPLDPTGGPANGTPPGGPGRAFPGPAAPSQYPSQPSSYSSQPPSYPSQSPSYPTPDRLGSFPSQGGSDGAFQTPYSTGEPRRRDAPPSVEISPMDPGQEEFLPIFASVESAWFRKPPADQFQQSPSGDEPNPTQAVPSVEESWRTAADAGWRAAAAASDPSLGGTTASGLPKRTPKANLVPGTAGQPQQQRQAPAPPLSAERARSRLASFQQGVRRGRAEVRGQEEQQ
ncbi:nitrate- and nitrite sensing domain-containing protein [Nonomuraea rhizosphaerae]|uniref:nitrate- and nitrite sensing domain-containing protein n=1 Tax=Nonomuraea rhizosphaerae TaxID=2665663 RepID=UPI001C5F24D7|nr:nitrate- and nitrite sensing domain-containing protein [Nonomuraea rhizosphaerae]